MTKGTLSQRFTKNTLVRKVTTTLAVTNTVKVSEKDTMSRKDCSPSLAECLRSLLDRPEEVSHSDMVIEVKPTGDGEGAQKFHVHRCIISCRTNIPVGEYFAIEGTFPSHFDTLLTFIYTDVAALSAHTVQRVLQLSRQFGISGLENECFNFLINTLCAQDIYKVLEEARQSSRRDVEELCVRNIRQNPDLFNSDDISSLSLPSLDFLFQRDDLPIEESVAFNSIMVWSKINCQLRGFDVTPENLRQLLGETLFRVRFIWLSGDFLRNVVGTSGILTIEEITDLWEIKSSGWFRDRSDKFNLAKRRGNDDENRHGLKKFNRFVEICNYDNSGSWECDSDSRDAVTLTVSKPVYLVGISLYGPREAPLGFYKVVLELNDGNKCVSKVKTEMLMKKSVITNRLEFPKPILLMRNHKYDICLRLRGPSTYYGSMTNPERMMETAIDGCTEFYQPDIPVFNQDGIDFTIGNSRLSSGDRTDSTQGQIPEILYRLPPVESQEEEKDRSIVIEQNQNNLSQDVTSSECNGHRNKVA